MRAHPPKAITDRPKMLHVAGHFGELMQGRLGAGGPVALISLPCPALGVTALARPAAGAGLSLHSPGQVGPILPLPLARLLLARLGLALPRRVVLRAQMPVGAGAGASTAALVALARAAGWRGSAIDLARACVAVEGASDPLMLPHPAQHLWASRQGQSLACLPALPEFDVLGGFWGPPRRTDAQDQRFPDILPLLPHWRAAAAAGDLDRLAQLASQSAQMTLALRGPPDDPTANLAARLGAKGYVIAHTGAARGLIFAKGAVPAQGVSQLRAAGMTGVLIFGQRTGWNQAAVPDPVSLKKPARSL